MRVVTSGAPYPLLGGLVVFVLGHGVRQAQVLVEAVIVVVGTAGPQREALDERHVVNQGGVCSHFCGPGLLVSGLVDGGKRAHEVVLVVLYGACVMSVVLDRKIRMHLNCLTCDGEPSCLGVTVVSTS